MASQAFTPTVYLMQGCPFCFKLRLFLLESGLLDDVEIDEFVPGSDSEQAMRDKLAPHLEKVSFPSAQLAPGDYMNGTDAIIERLAAGAEVDPATLPTLQAFVAGPLKAQVSLYQENVALKKQLN